MKKTTKKPQQQSVGVALERSLQKLDLCSPLLYYIRTYAYYTQISCQQSGCIMGNVDARFWHGGKMHGIKKMIFLILLRRFWSFLKKNCPSYRSATLNQSGSFLRKLKEAQSEIHLGFKGTICDLTVKTNRLKTFREPLIKYVITGANTGHRLDLGLQYFQMLLKVCLHHWCSALK